MAFVGIVAIVAWSPPLELFTREGSGQRQFVGLGLTEAAVILALLKGAIQTGLTEEILFRGLIAGSLSRRLPIFWANLAQAFVFFLPHLLLLHVMPEMWGLLPLIFVLAFVLGWLRIKSGHPHLTGKLRVSKLHTVHFEVYGNPRGKPLVFLHGGPGGGIDPAYHRYFDPKKWRIVLFDQRGCGKSTPHAELRENTTWDLVADIEKLREHLGIERWVVFGGSWGSTLSIAYAETHPKRCKALVLRGIFLLRRSELLWFYQEGASQLFPDAWEGYLAPIPPRERGDMMRAYYKRLTSRDKRVRRQAARAWSVWEGTTSKLFTDPKLVKRFGTGRFADAFARIEAHYFVHTGFLKRDDQLLRDVKKIRKIPAVIVQGRYDVVCPMRSAWDLHRAWPEAKLVVIPDSGHSMSEPGIRSALIRETERFARL